MARLSARLVSNLLLLALAVGVGVLLLRVDPGADGLPGLRPEPMFGEEELPPLRGTWREEAEALPAGAEASPAAAEAPPAAGIAPSVAGTPAAAPPAVTEALYADWARARRLLRQRDFAGAEQAYRALVRRWPGHPDLHGELGNVYVFLDRRAAAREAFGRARELLRPLGPSLPLRAVERWLAADGGY